MSERLARTMFVVTLHRLSGSALITFPMLALLAVGSGYFQAPQPDEGSAAHVFQLSIAALVPAILLFVATADRRQPFPTRLFGYVAIIVAIAFGALFYLERVYNR